ncbi:ATP-binding protein [Amycolatopsis sp. NPDC059657]|uniref:ATP-binding protein n=1 Tax=Amycolatopsis sp. NPDC059657 TaxID=3346899 RepID=UPI00366A71A5
MTSPLAAPRPGTWVLDLRGTSPRTLAAVRTWAATCLADLGGVHRADVLLIASELVANAYLHGGGPRHIQLWRGVRPCAVRIEVGDFSADHPLVTRTLSGHSDALGIRLVDRVAVRWGVHHGPHHDGKTLWAHISCDGGCGPEDC